MLPIVMHVEGAFEPDELRAAVDQHDRFLFLKDSLTILDADAFWSTLPSAGPAWLFARPSCYLAVYTADTLCVALAEAPHAGDKEASIVWESRLHELLDYPTVWPQVRDTTALRADIIDGHLELIIGVPGVVEKAKGTARCRRCPHVNGVCPHFLRRFRGSSHAPRLHRLEPAGIEVRA